MVSIEPYFEESSYKFYGRALIVHVTVSGDSDPENYSLRVKFIKKSILLSSRMCGLFKFGDYNFLCSM